MKVAAGIILYLGLGVATLPIWVWFLARARFHQQYLPGTTVSLPRAKDNRAELGYVLIWPVLLPIALFLLVVLEVLMLLCTASSRLQPGDASGPSVNVEGANSSEKAQG